MWPPLLEPSLDILDLPLVFWRYWFECVKSVDEKGLSKWPNLDTLTSRCIVRASIQNFAQGLIL
jgi:hypothetical protein